MTHKSQYPQLLNQFEQVNLCVEFFLGTNEKSFIIILLAFVLFACTTATPAKDEPMEGVLPWSPKGLPVLIAENVALFYFILNLKLFLVVVVINCALLEVWFWSTSAWLLPREYFFNHWLVNCKLLVCSQREICHPSQHRDEATKSHE